MPSDDGLSGELRHLESTDTVEPRDAPRYERIGRYHLKRIIATGGMGTVYEATQEQPRRTVAIKVMKRGIASRSALRRFEYEAQILARLRHPGVAQIYEAGTHRDDTGELPYFAMEYIPNGKPITRYVKEKNLGVRDRMQLFGRVCDAVQHGHQKGIIHRDLKPSNILVDSDGQVKIIDFGVARATDADLAITTLQTDVGQLIGTLQYMSPEQCEADPHDIDTRSDVYALGVVFFELMTDQFPYDVRHRAIHEATRVIREDPPTRLGTLDRRLRGDVETIALKALEKDRRRRYQSAADLEADIAAYLARRPIKARPPSVVYRFNKFLQRRRVPVAACVAIFATVVFAADRQIRASLAGTRLRSLEIAYKVFSAAQPDVDLNQRSEVIEDCTRAIAMDPSFALAYTLRAKKYYLLGDNEAAWRDCRKALELDPDNALARRTEAYLLLKRGDLDGSRIAYRLGFEKFTLSTDLPRDLHNRATVHTRLGDLENALRFYDGAVALSPESSLLYVGRALARRFAGNVGGALTDLDRAMKLRPHQWTLQANLWKWEMLMLRDEPGDRDAADKALSFAEQAAQNALEKDIAAVCRGKSDGQAALNAAQKPGLRCAVYYYLCAKALVDGRIDDARALCNQSLATEEFEQPEFDLAKWHLAESR